MFDHTSTTPEEIWETACEYLKDSLSPFVYNDYISHVSPLNYDGETFRLIADDELRRSVLENRYITVINQALKFSTLNQCKNVKIITKREEATYTQEASALYSASNQASGQNILNPKYTFENFIVGANNRLAHAAALGVANSPAKKYNPLFIYGGVGLGKTHLMQAIAHSIRENYPKMKVLYISSERFTNDFIESIQNRTNIQFRNKYRKIDVLLLDDIQFLAKKEGTQEEFFHAFNDLYEAQKQVILSSDKHPKEIPNLEERLRSRFEWGLTCDISPPNFETRVAILRKKAASEGIFIANESLEFIADHAISNVRELEGILMNVKAISEMEGQMLSVEEIRKMLGEVFTKTDKKVSVETIIGHTAKHYGVTYSDMISQKRPSNLANARQVAMYLAREMTELSLPEIGQAFGGKNHSTVIHACNKIKEEVLTNSNLKKDMDEIIGSLKNV